MRKFTILSAASVVGAVAFATSAQAAVVVGFTPGASSPPPGYTIFADFDTTLGGVTTGEKVQIKTNNDGDGAPPAFANPLGTAYLSVLGGGEGTITFDSAVDGFAFDWGSIDSFNTLTIFSTDGPPVVYTGSNFSNPANGNQGAAFTNGLFKATGTLGTKFTGFKLESSQNSFEIDNVAIANPVPEPATWAMMLLGFGAVGFGMRRRRGREKLRVRYAF